MIPLVSALERLRVALPITIDCRLAVTAGGKPRPAYAVRHTLRDPRVGELLDLARRILNNHFDDGQALRRELRREHRRG